MESRILFLGPVGAGKTQAIRTISDIETVSTEVAASDHVAQLKATTTVAMDMGVLNLDDSDRIVLYGAPGQDRFDFMWDILLDQSEGVLLLIDHSAADPLRDLDHYRQTLRTRKGRARALAVGVTHIDRMPRRPFSMYAEHLDRVRGSCSCEVCCPPVLAMDARERRDVRAGLISLVAAIEMTQRYPSKACSA